VREDHLVFCRRRPEKAEHCERLAITHFIDDRVDVLEPMRGRVPHLFLFGPQRAPLPAGEWCAPVRDWQCAEGAVLETLAPAATGREAAPECQLAPGPVA
jgi:hypothetical protein